MHNKLKATSLLAVFLISVACRNDQGRLPDELVGSWSTENPAYRNRQVKLEKDYVLIGFGEDVTPTVERITKVETLKITTGIACTIFSADKEGSHQLTIFFNPKEPGFLYLKNVPGKWHKS